MCKLTEKYRKREKLSTFNDWLDDYVKVTEENIPLPSKDGKKCEEVV